MFRQVRERQTTNLLPTLPRIGFVLLFVFTAFFSFAKPVTHLAPVAARAKPIDRLNPQQRVSLAIALPPKNRAAIDAFVESLYDPASANYRRFVTPEQFGTMFGASDEDYAAVQTWAKSKNFKIRRTYKNRLMVSLNASAGDIEKAFHVAMNVYDHPAENRTFFSADREPIIDAPMALASIEGLSSYSKPRAKSRKISNVTPKGGTGPNGAYVGSDFRKAYVPTTTLTGAGQTIGLLQFDDFYTNDIVKYRTLAGLPNIQLITVPIDGGVAAPGSGNSEVSLDIAMAMSMAPGLSGIYVYEASDPSPWMDILAPMADDNLSRQLSCSWGGGDPDDSLEVVFQQMAAQGQSFFNASGDTDALTPPIQFPSESPSITQVGGTTLVASGSQGYVSEIVWNWGYVSTYSEYLGSSGGISGYYGLPSYQQGIDMSANHGSASHRNIPDVAFTADDIYVTYDNGLASTFGGTSCAAPLWAGFMALVNQMNAASNRPPAGFVNPLLYTLGKTSAAGAFNDIQSGNNTNNTSAGRWFAATGYDLCTGWGTPGLNLLNLFSQASAIVTDLQMTCTNGPAPAHTNAPYTFAYTITNAGPFAATNVVFTSAMSSDFTVLSITSTQGACTNTSSSITANLGNLDTNATARVTIAIVPSTPGYLINSAIVSSDVDDPIPSNNSVQTVVLVDPIYNVSATGFPTAAIINWDTFTDATGQIAYGTSTNYSAVSTLESTPRSTHAALLTGLLPDQVYYFQITSVADGITYIATGSFVTIATVILEEADATYTGNWTLSSDAPDKYGDYFEYAPTSSDPFNADSIASFDATLPAPGKYGISLWYPSGSTHSTNTPISIPIATGTLSLNIDQTRGGAWVPVVSSLDCPDATASVEILNNTGETDKVVVANAAKFVYDLNQDKSTNGTIPSWWLQYFLGTTSASGLDDLDGDGYSNFEEYVLGTNPADADSKLSFSSQNTTNGLQITFAPFQGGRVYQLQYRRDFNSPWTTLPDVPTVDANGNGNFLVNQTGFFRLQVSLAQ